MQIADCAFMGKMKEHRLRVRDRSGPQASQISWSTEEEPHPTQPIRCATRTTPVQLVLAWLWVSLTKPPNTSCSLTSKLHLAPLPSTYITFPEELECNHKPVRGADWWWSWWTMLILSETLNSYLRHTISHQCLAFQASLKVEAPHSITSVWAGVEMTRNVSLSMNVPITFSRRRCSSIFHLLQWRFQTL